MSLKLLLLCLLGRATSLMRSGFGLKWTQFDNIIMSKNIISEVSDVHCGKRCVLQCLQNDGCISVFYRRQHRRCQFHDVLFMSPEDGEQETGTEYYSLTTGICPTHYVQNRLLNLCYQFHTVTTSYDDALADCTSRGEHFMVIDSEDKQTHFVTQSTSSKVTAKCSYFIDGSDAANEGQWEFHDGRPMPFFAWSPGFPANASSSLDYIIAKKLVTNGSAYLWTERARFHSNCYICQRDI
ncbi:C-type lectin domain family 4 member E-like [Haliotis asinina]|uniref:C-type lectin domain family 4 member E-like n=1 Tax=Haliotis asinina TaxID=109174 RepID=UPI00353188D8